MTNAAKKLEAIKNELRFIGRETQRINGDNSDTFESLDAIGQSVQIALALAFEIELDAQPDTTDLLAA